MLHQTIAPVVIYINELESMGASLEKRILVN